MKKEAGDMAQFSPRMSQATTAAVVGSVGLTLLASLRARGMKDTALFFALGTLLPVAAEYQAINGSRILRHHLQPQVQGVPVAIALAWYLTGYNTFAALESLTVQYDVGEGQRKLLLPLATALTATSMDLVADVALLEQGYWEWNEDGSYAPEIQGPNGKRGVPIGNYVGWLVLTSLVSGLFYLLGGGRTKLDQGRARVSGRTAALLLLPSYLGAVAWELRQGRWRYVAYSLLFPLVLLPALIGKRAS